MHTNKKRSAMPVQKYDNTDPFSIYEYSKGLIGHSLYDLLGNNVIEYFKKGKGGLGQMVEELYFGYKINTDEHPDFEEAGLELKCTPLLKYKSTDEWRIKERLVCTMIDYNKIITESFEDSHFLQKCKLMLLLFYLHVYHEKSYNFKFFFRVLWQLPEKDLLIMKHDYEVIINKIKTGKAHLLSEGDTVYLAACRKGQKGEKPQKQPYSETLAPRRAFSLKPAYMRTILKEVVSTKQDHLTNVSFNKNQNTEIVSIESLRKASLEDIILNRFKPFYGKDYIEICNILHINESTAKQKYSIAANSIISKNIKNIDDSEEFQKSGIRLKTVRVSETGMPEESMSFKNIDYIAVANTNEWINSEVYELFTSRFLFVVFKEVKNQTININKRETKNNSIKTVKENRYILDKVFFWTMPIKNLSIAYEYWQNIKSNVDNNHIELKYFWSIKMKKLFHVRPKGIKTSYKQAAENPNGGKADKYCYWFNADYVKSIIELQK